MASVFVYSIVLALMILAGSILVGIAAAIMVVVFQHTYDYLKGE